MHILPRFYVKNPTFSNFTELLTAINSSAVPFTRYFFNSLLVTVASTTLSIFVCSLATFAMTKMKLPFKNGIFNFIVAAMAFSAPASQVTTYLDRQRHGDDEYILGADHTKGSDRHVFLPDEAKHGNHSRRPD